MSEKDPLELDERCIECGVRFDDALGHKSWCSQYLSPTDAGWVSKLLTKTPERPVCPECHMPGWHLEDCSSYRADLGQRMEAARLVERWRGSGVISKWLSRFLQVALAEGQDMTIGYDGLGRPHIEWGGLVYPLRELEEMVRDHAQYFS